MTRKIMKQVETGAFNEALLTAARSSADDLLARYGVTEKRGFTEEEAEERRDEYGRNIISRHKKDSLFKRIFEAFVNPFTVVLFLLALISVFTDIIFAPPGERDATAAIIVFGMVTISGLLRFVQETRSGNAAERLRDMIKTTTSVVRDGKKIEIPLQDVVLGDIVHLAAGDMCPADLRILSSKDLFVSQSSLTGESHPVEKLSAPAAAGAKNALELNNLAFMGSNVVSGSAVCVVAAIGDNTVFGTLAKSLVAKKTLTNFEKGVNSVSWLLIRFMAIMVPIVFFVNGLTKHDWLNALMFGLSIAVGLTPEMLPMIVTTGLAKGAVKMARQQTVIKNLNSIQNFGAMDILCTDKTGTLTQDKIVLEKYLDIEGNEDVRILRHAFLNSYFQTGLKNLMDIAVIDHIDEKHIADLAQKYVKVDEIPFDFARRRMSVVIKDDTGKTQMITKGAAEEMLNISSYAEYTGGRVLPLTDDMKKDILKTVNKLNGEGMRVLAVAQKTEPSPVGAFSVKDEAQMVLIGYLAFLDPPKASAAAAISALSEYGVRVKVLTGDNAEVTECICRQVGIKGAGLLLGGDVEEMSDEALSRAVEKNDIFAKLSPAQKARIIAALRSNGHTVGFMGDGINDAAALREADVGISVDTAVDVAKESADIILLQKDLTVLERGVIEGRRTFANIVKYIKMTASSNFGNMFSVLAASWLPFLPMMPIQILVLNLIYDVSCISIPWDNVDREYLKEPKKWDASSIAKFMLWIGPTSSVFDIGTYLLMYFIICPRTYGGFTDAETSGDFVALFQTGWFVESLWTQTLVVHMIRTPKVPFIHSRSSKPVLGFTLGAICVGTALPFTPLAHGLGMTPLPWLFFPILVGIVLAYTGLVTVVKKFYIRRYGGLL